MVAHDSTSKNALPTLAHEEHSLAHSSFEVCRSGSTIWDHGISKPSPSLTEWPTEALIAIVKELVQGVTLRVKEPPSCSMQPPTK